MINQECNQITYRHFTFNGIRTFVNCILKDYTFNKTFQLVCFYVFHCIYTFTSWIILKFQNFLKWLWCNKAGFTEIMWLYVHRITGSNNWFAKASWSNWFNWFKASKQCFPPITKHVKQNKKESVLPSNVCAIKPNVLLMLSYLTVIWILQ